MNVICRRLRPERGERSFRGWMMLGWIWQTQIDGLPKKYRVVAADPRARSARATNQPMDICRILAAEIIKSSSISLG